MLVILVAVFALAACQTGEQPEASTDVGEAHQNSVAVTETYGEPVDATRAMAVRAAVDSAQALDGTDVVVKGRISRVCQKKGCWLAMDAGTARPVRVLVPRTGDGYGFTVPTDASGEAVVHGTLSIKALDTTTRDHYESDGAARPDRIEIQIAARGIQISPKS